MSEYSDFCPDWVSPPGDTIADILDNRHLTVEEFSSLMECSVDNARALIAGCISITQKIAIKLESIVGVPACFWLRREVQYREDAARVALANDQEGLLDSWLKEMPIKEMIQFGWIEPVNIRLDKVKECLRFFEVSSLAQWGEKYLSPTQAVAFRTSFTFPSKEIPVAAWLRQAEIQSELLECEPWNLSLFENSLGAIRSLSREKKPEVFLPMLYDICRGCGVAVAIVRAPKGCRASGATKFLTKDKALLVLSFRYLSDDHFWFTFFHEAAHLILHGKDSLFMEGFEKVSSLEEDQANLYAAKVLIPDVFLDEFNALPAEGKSLIRFSRKIGISPGIVVGQLQYKKRIHPSQLNTLKVRYCWGE